MKNGRLGVSRDW